MGPLPQPLVNIEKSHINIFMGDEALHTLEETLGEKMNWVLLGEKI